MNGTVAGHSDFIGTSQSIAFPAGVGDLMTSATFTIADDGHPEPDYTYAIQMKVTSGDAVISQSRIATVTVVANNDPFGVFGFLMVSYSYLLNYYFSALYDTVPYKNCLSRVGMLHL